MGPNRAVRGHAYKYLSLKFGQPRWSNNTHIITLNIILVKTSTSSESLPTSTIGLKNLLFEVKLSVFKFEKYIHRVLDQKKIVPTFLDVQDFKLQVS